MANCKLLGKEDVDKDVGVIHIHAMMSFGWKVFQSGKHESKWLPTYSNGLLNLQ